MRLVCLVLNSFSFRAAFKAALQPGNLASALARDISRLPPFCFCHFANQVCDYFAVWMVADKYDAGL
jgi:hypothetical protein